MPRYVICLCERCSERVVSERERYRGRVREKWEKTACAAEISGDPCRMLHCEACVDAFAALSNKAAYSNQRIDIYVYVYVLLHVYKIM